MDQNLNRLLGLGRMWMMGPGWKYVFHTRRELAPLPVPAMLRFLPAMTWAATPHPKHGELRHQEPQSDHSDQLLAQESWSHCLCAARTEFHQISTCWLITLWPSVLESHINSDNTSQDLSMASEHQSVIGDRSWQQLRYNNNLGVLPRAILIQPTLERAGASFVGKSLS